MTATATSTKTSLENITIFLFVHLRDYFNSGSTCLKTSNCPKTKLVGVASKLRKRMKIHPSCAHVLHKTSNLVISRCCFVEGGKEMYHNLKRTCRAIVFPR